MSSKIGLNLSKNYSYNFSPLKRLKKDVKFIIVHYTGMKKEADAIRRLCDKKSKVSSHYFIKKNGKILNLVPDLYVAWHAGNSQWKKFKSLNRYSIGIEIHNSGHDNKLENFSRVQINSLKKLLKFLIDEYKIHSNNILGHSDVAPYRKKDPGEKFPWSFFAKKNLCTWHNLDTNKIKVYRNIQLSYIEEKKFIKNLNRIGYHIIQRANKKKNTKFLVKAFQRRFRQSLVNGKIDKECYLISENIKKSYN